MDKQAGQQDSGSTSPSESPQQQQPTASQSTDALGPSGLDGFLTAMAVGPAEISAEDWAPVALGGAIDQVAARPDGQTLIRSVVDRFNGILDALAEGAYQPALPDGAERTAAAHAWALGFQQGIGLKQAAWEPLAGDMDSARLILPTVILAADEAQRRALSPAGFDPEVLAELIDGLPDTVADIATFWAERELDDQDDEGSAGRSVPDAGADWTRAAAALPPKVGRNEPCPCGSGKKFKKCCGG